MCRSRRAEQISLPPPIFYIFPAISRQPNHSPPIITFHLSAVQLQECWGKMPQFTANGRHRFPLRVIRYVFEYTAKIESHSIKMLYMNSIKLCLVSSLKYTKIENDIIFARHGNS